MQSTSIDFNSIDSIKFSMYRSIRRSIHERIDEINTYINKSIDRSIDRSNDVRERSIARSSTLVSRVALVRLDPEYWDSSESMTQRTNDRPTSLTSLTDLPDRRDVEREFHLRPLATALAFVRQRSIDRSFIDTIHSTLHCRATAIVVDIVRRSYNTSRATTCATSVVL